MTNEEIKKKLDCTARITGNELVKSALNIITVQEEEIDDLKAENKQLKTECALLDDELRIARQETIDVLNKVKERAVGLAAIETYHICNLIDEIIKEYENENQRR
jgi:hypothetical protein